MDVNSNANFARLLRCSVTTSLHAAEPHSATSQPRADAAQYRRKTGR